MKRHLHRLAIIAFFLIMFVVPMQGKAQGADNVINRGILDALFGREFPEIESNLFTEDLADEVSGGLPTQVQSRQHPAFLLIRLISIALSFIGIGTIAFMIYAGFLWMTSAGNEDQVTKAKTIIRNSVIGLILILSSYTLTYYVGLRIQRATGTRGSGATFQATEPDNVVDFSGGAQSVIEGRTNIQLGP